MCKATSYSATQFKELGLEAAGYGHWRNFQQHAQDERYTKAFGVCPDTSSTMWHMLRDHQDDNIQLPTNANPMHLLLLHRFLWEYETESEIARFFGKHNQLASERTVRKWIRYYAPRVQLLLKELMGPLEAADDGLIFMLSIDGTHCPIDEPRPFSTKWSSHKLGGKPGVNYELAVTINHPRLVWVYGPTPPGKMNDIKVFKSKLMNIMKQRLPGRRLIGDSGYSGVPDLISTKNEFDPREVSEFKDRVMARHETYNQRLKCYGVLTKHFRHEDRIQVHGICFRAVCVHVILQMRHGHGLLFDPYP